VTSADGETVISDETTVIDANSSLSNSNSNSNSNSDSNEDKSDHGSHSHDDENGYEGSGDDYDYNEGIDDSENYEEQEGEATPKATDKAWMSDPNGSDSTGQTSMGSDEGSTAIEGEEDGMMSIQTVPNSGQQSGVDMMDSMQ